MKNLKSFNNFIVESTEQEMMDYLNDITNKPESSGTVEVDTSTNPLWNQIWSGLSGVGKPKKLMWKDYDTEIGRASLNWGTHAGRGSSMGAGSVGLSVDSYSQNFMVTVKKREEMEAVMKALKPFNFPKIDNSGGTGQLITVNYTGVKDPQKVISAVTEVLKSFGLA
jgi:hypothetical protein